MGCSGPRTTGWGGRANKQRDGQRCLSYNGLHGCCVGKLFLGKKKKKSSIKASQGFSGGPVIKPAKARGHGFDPWSRKIPHTKEQLHL